MPFIAAASINIFATAVVAVTLAILLFGCLFALMIYGAILAVRRISGNESEPARSVRPRGLRAQDRRLLPVPQTPAGAGH
jgi:hypothetical protein